MIKEVYSEKETRDFAYEMAQKAEVGQVYCLDGDSGVYAARRSWCWENRVYAGLCSRSWNYRAG